MRVNCSKRLLNNWPGLVFCQISCQRIEFSSFRWGEYVNSFDLISSFPRHEMHICLRLIHGKSNEFQYLNLFLLISWNVSMPIRSSPAHTFSANSICMEQKICVLCSRHSIKIYYCSVHTRSMWASMVYCMPNRFGSCRHRRCRRLPLLWPTNTWHQLDNVDACERKAKTIICSRIMQHKFVRSLAFHLEKSTHFLMCMHTFIEF